MISILKLISPDNLLLDWWSTIYPMLSILDLIQLVLHDSPCGEPYWVCIRIIAFFYLVISLPLLRLMAYGCLSFYFRACFFWIFVILLWSLWEFGRFIYFTHWFILPIRGLIFQSNRFVWSNWSANWIIFSIFICFFLGCRSSIADCLITPTCVLEHTPYPCIYGCTFIALSVHPAGIIGSG